MPYILFADEKNVRSFGSLKYHPVYLTVGALPADMRLDFNNWKLIGYIPVLTFLSTDNEEFQQETRQKHFAVCLEVFLKDVQEKSARLTKYFILILFFHF